MKVLHYEMSCVTMWSHIHQANLPRACLHLLHREKEIISKLKKSYNIIAMIDLDSLTIVKARKALDAGEFSAVDLAKAYLAEIEKKNTQLNVYLEVFD